MATAKSKIQLIVEAKVRDALNKLNETEKEIDDLSKSAAKVNGALSKIGGIIKGVFSAIAIEQLVDYTVEVTNLAGQSEGLRRSLDNLAKKEGVDVVKLMNDMRKATANTVSDLELMKNATQAKFLGLDLKNLPVLFEFAAKRARDTGQSIDFLVQSIVTGIGRKSPLILDNLGIQMRDLDAEVKKIAISTGTWNGEVDQNLRNMHLQAAAVKLAKDQIKESGTQSLTAADNIAQFNAAIDNMKVALGGLLAGPLGDFIKDLTVIIRLLSGDKGAEISRLQNEIESLVQTIDRLERGDFSITERIFGIVDPEFFREQLKKTRVELLKLITPEIQEGLKRTGRAFEEMVKSVSGDAGAGSNINAEIKELGELAIRDSEAFHQLFATVDENAPGFAEALRKGTIELQEQERLALEVGGIIENAFVNLATSLADSATKGSQAWADFFSDLKRQIISFLVSKAVASFLNFIAGAFFPGGGSLFGAGLGILSSIFKGGGGSNITAPGFSPGGGGNLVSPTLRLSPITAPVAAGGFGGGTVVNNTFGSARGSSGSAQPGGKIVVEVQTPAPDFTTVRAYYREVNRNILIPDTDLVNQFNRTEKSEFD